MDVEGESGLMVFRLPEEKSDDEVFSDNSKRSSTASDKMSDKSTEEDTTTGVGAKRKMEFEEEEEEDDDDLGYYDSSDDPDCCEEETVTVTEDQEVEQYSDPDPELYDSDGDPIPDSEITMWMENDPRSDEQKNKLLPKIKRFLYSVKQSEGFDCTHYPGFIRGLQHSIPRTKVIADRDRHPEGYNHLFYMASLAIQEYNKKSDTKLKVLAVEKSMYRGVSRGCDYKITFTAVYGGMQTTFLACVYDDTVSRSLSVCSCKVKPNSQSRVAEKELSDKPIGNEEPDLVTIISKLNSFSNEQLMELIKNTKKDKNMLLKYVRKYFDSIIKSQGFKCSNYPGDIPGLTYLKPRLKILVQRKRYYEGCNHAELMAKVAMDYYYRDETDECRSLVGSLSFICRRVKRVVSLNLWKKSSCYIYYMSFIITKVYEETESDYRFGDTYKEDTALEAIVQDNQDHIVPIYCGPARFI